MRTRAAVLSTILLSTTMFAGTALADVAPTPPDEQACLGKAAGDACTYGGGGASDVCVQTTPCQFMASCLVCGPKPTTPIPDAGTLPLADAGTQPATDAGTQPATDAGTQPATDAGTQPVTDVGTKVGAGGSGADTGTTASGCSLVQANDMRPLAGWAIASAFSLLLVSRRRRRS